MKKILSIFMSTIMIVLTITQFSIFASANDEGIKSTFSL